MFTFPIGLFSGGADPVLLTPNLYWYQNADYQHFLTNGGAVAASGETVGYFESQGSSGINATQATSGSRGSISTINGKRSLTYDGGDFYQVGASTNWNFLHNTNGFTAVIVFKKNTSNPGDVLMTLLDTCAISSSNIGFSVFYENRTVLSNPNTLRIFVGSGSPGSHVFAQQAANNIFPGTTPHIIVVRFNPATPIIIARVNGTQVISRTNYEFSSPTSSNSTFPLNLGRTGSNTGLLTGQMPLVAFYNRPLNDTEISNIEAYWMVEYGI
jgi:Concanavalin A-like lectin/glucanases superfamily